MNPARTLLLTLVSLSLAGCATGDHKTRTTAHSLLCVIFCVKIDTEHTTESVLDPPAEGKETASPANANPEPTPSA